jgi:hypothetical protein
MCRYRPSKQSRAPEISSTLWEKKEEKKEDKWTFDFEKSETKQTNQYRIR